MQFTYFYKTSDGLRHKAEIGAPSREEAFSALRQQGIRPIKLFANEPVPRKRSWKRWAVIALLAAAVAVLAVRMRQDASVPPKPAQPVLAATNEVWGAKSGSQGVTSAVIAISSDPAYTNLEIKVRGVVGQRAKSLAALDLDILKNYALIESISDLSRLTAEIEKARSIIEASRMQTKEVFRSAFDEVRENDLATRMAIQQLYAKVSDGLDLDEARVDASELSMFLLDENRGKWRTHKGKIIFTDTQLESEFKLITSQTDAASIRWRKEMGTRR